MSSNKDNDAGGVELSHEIEDGLGGGATNFFSRLNPIRLFRKNSPQYALSEANSLLERNLFAQATIQFEVALSLAPKNLEAFKGLGRVFMKKGGRSNLEIAVTTLNKGINIDPLEEELYSLKANVLKMLGREKEANIEKKKAVSLATVKRDPNNPIANNNIGIAMMKLNKTELAISYFKNSINSNANYDTARRNLATVYLQLAEADSNPQRRDSLLGLARAEVERAREIAETVPTLTTLARILIRSEEGERALEILAKADDLSPANKLIFNLRQRALESLNRLGEAREVLESANMLAQHTGSR